MVGVAPVTAELSVAVSVVPPHAVVSHSASVISHASTTVMASRLVSCAKRAAAGRVSVHRDKKRGELGPELSHAACRSGGGEVYGAGCGGQPGAAGCFVAEHR